jgi:RNA polymerase sigma factor (TIGR02999 family)
MFGGDLTPAGVTQLLVQMRSGDAAAMDRLFTIVHRELRGVAVNLMRKERSNHTLQPTALVNEAYLRLVADPGMDFQNRAHFFAVASRAMRRVLVEHARTKRAEKRGGKQAQVEMDDALAAVNVEVENLIAVDEALTQLEELDSLQAKMIEMQYFLGNSIEEIAAATGSSERTAKRELQTARLFLAKQLHSAGRTLTPLSTYFVY